MPNSTLIKTTLRNSIAEGIYKEITNRSGRYFYFLGKTLVWEDETSPVIPVDSITYSQSTRNEIITVKEITPTDVSFVIPRYDWESGIIYDQSYLGITNETSVGVISLTVMISFLVD